MLLGIDFGTTRTVVAAADRGNYPVVSFRDENDNPQEWYPSLIAFSGPGAKLEYGFEAASRQHDRDWSVIRSFKRDLATLGPESPVEFGSVPVSAISVLTDFLVQLRIDLSERSNLHLTPGEKLEVLISVPANANSNQRYITLEAFRLAGFLVKGTLNEPSAAGVEYAHRYRNVGRIASRREHIVVYDLGGGTFDASVISMTDQLHEVLSSHGIGRLGGDDFDRILLDLAIESAGISEISPETRIILLEECREKKEGLHPNTRRVAIDFERALPGMGEVVVGTSDFYDRCRPLVQKTIDATEQALTGATGLDRRSIAAVYMVGGSSDLPIVARTLRERYSRLLRRSPYPHAATAIGLAIAADVKAGYEINERFTRHFGVWREIESGSSVTMDVIFPKDTRLPVNGEKLRQVRRYRPTHNVGHFRFAECSRVDEHGHPTGDITLWEEIFFPFTAELEYSLDLSAVPVQRTPPKEEIIEEIYSCDEHGIIEVRIVNLSTNHQRTARLHRPGAARTVA
jgi:molecular chaperone DnaK (HSP70)